MPRERSCFGFLFSLSIVVGIALAIIIRNGMKSADLDPTTLPPQDLQEGGDPNPEDTILIIGVESLEGQTHNLEGAWLAKLCTEADHPNDTIHIILLTLYPVLAENLDNFELRDLAKAHPPIQIDPDDLESLANIPPIALSGKSWSHVILLDEVAMNTAIHLNDVNKSAPINTPSPDTFFKPWQDPAKAYQQQWRIIKTLCDEPDAYGNLNTIQEIINLYGTNVKSSLTGQGLLKLWQLVNLNQGDEVLCELYPDLQD